MWILLWAWPHVMVVPTYPVSGSVLHVEHYCAGGGAAVTDEMEEAAHHETPMSGFTLAFSPGDTISDAARTATTDSNGRFRVQLPAGRWCVFAAARAPKPGERASVAAVLGGSAVAPAPGSDVDAGCLEAQRWRCDETIDVDSRPLKDVSVQFWAECPQPFNKPCYVGPQPP